MGDSVIGSTRVSLTGFKGEVYGYGCAAKSKMSHTSAEYCRVDPGNQVDEQRILIDAQDKARNPRSSTPRNDRNG